jgi:aryl-alcohol dehydrogenase-like predicted oxidoreductase
VKYRRLGRNGPRVSAIGMGRGAQSVRFGEPLEKDFNATIARAVDLGINFFDSSDASAEMKRLSEVFAIGAGERYNPKLLEKWGI